MAEDRKAILKRVYDEVINGGNIDLADELLAEDFVDHEESPGQTPDREGAKQGFRRLRSAFPDIRFHAEQFVQEGDFVASRLRLTGTHKGEFAGVPPTGKQIDVQAMDMIRFKGDRIAEHWGVTDGKLMRQLGLLPQT